MHNYAHPVEVIVSGGRDHDEPGIIRAVLDDLLGALRGLPQQPMLLLVEGGAPGADSHAREWAWEHAGEVILETHNADWVSYGKAAGPIRNKKMRDLHPEATLLAFPTPGSKGTWHMVKICKELGMHVVVIEDEGTLGNQASDG